MMIGNPKLLALDISIDEAESLGWNHLWASARLWVGGQTFPGYNARSEQFYLLEAGFDPNRWIAADLQFSGLAFRPPVEIISTVWDSVFRYRVPCDVDLIRKYKKAILAPEVIQLEDCAVVVLGLETGFRIVASQVPQRDSSGDPIPPTDALAIEVNGGFFSELQSQIIAFADRESASRGLSIPWRQD